MAAEYLWIWPVAFALVFGGGHYLVRSIYTEPISGELRDFLSTAGFRIGTLHALVASLAFSTIAAEQLEFSKTTESEALAIERMFLILLEIDGLEAHQARKHLTTYLEEVISVEIPFLGGETVSAKASIALQKFEAALRNVVAINADDPSAGFLFEELREVKKARGQRSFDNFRPLPAAIKFVVILGFLGTLGCFLGFQRNFATSTGIAAFSAINGVIIGALWMSQYPNSVYERSILLPFEIVNQRTFIAISN
ncbi:hypothetical protein [Ruegeria arenilitoris]|uniref:bestrophin-like domain n=1 Tax=Ruegeria arenilitoris TaxID=1173585 RepID=UPI001479C069|nr:hypothetical protein [Ruegeria arenilitoris]